jgi:hypothetical protein
LATRTSLDVLTAPGPIAAAAAVWVESGRPWLPDVADLRGRPLAGWLIDTHRGVRWRARLAKGFDATFTAQRRAVQDLRASTGVEATWLPLAVAHDDCVPGPPLPSRRWDVAFVGATPPGSFRSALLEALQGKVDLAPWGSYVAPDSMMALYRDARIVLNVPVSDDLNMRAFEASGAGALLVTGPMDGLDAILPAGAAHIVPERSVGNWVSEICAALADPDIADRANAGRTAVISRHTYDHRAETLLDALTSMASPSSLGAVTERERATAFGAAYARWGAPGEALRQPAGRFDTARHAVTAVGWKVATAIKPLIGGRFGTTRF